MIGFFSAPQRLSIRWKRLMVSTHFFFSDSALSHLLQTSSYLHCSLEHVAEAQYAPLVVRGSFEEVQHLLLVGQDCRVIEPGDIILAETLLLLEPVLEGGLECGNMFFKCSKAFPEELNTFYLFLFLFLFYFFFKQNEKFIMSDHCRIPLWSNGMGFCHPELLWIMGLFKLIGFACPPANLLVIHESNRKGDMTS
jgi:hypothetical protein